MVVCLYGALRKYWGTFLTQIPTHQCTRIVSGRFFSWLIGGTIARQKYSIRHGWFVRTSLWASGLPDGLVPYLCSTQVNPILLVTIIIQLLVTNFYIFYAMEIVEGKDNPKELPGGPKNSTGNTNEILLRLKNVLHATGMVVVLYRIFCMIHVLV